MVLDAEVGEAVRVDVHALAGVRQFVLVLGAAGGGGEFALTKEEDRYPFSMSMRRLINL